MTYIIIAIVFLIIGYHWGYGRGVKDAKDYTYGRVNELLREQFDFENIK